MMIPPDPKLDGSSAALRPLNAVCDFKREYSAIINTLSKLRMEYEKEPIKELEKTIVSRLSQRADTTNYGLI
jgi:hypothetical protein